ncbi:O-antigen ligase family protein [Pannus brasiliensis CCIBt3594]|uniref:O-antigen ligase family protein n=1 Tax=Pannus brasiliensis CCIBt3594 TaxID=1427578 RepID=A0AAW9QSS3_9CHRO
MTRSFQGDPSPDSRDPFVSSRLQKKIAWIAILGLIPITALGIFASHPIFRLVFPLACFVVGILLYQKYPPLYVGFTWWIWFLTPLVRRLIDYRVGYEDQSLVLMAPFLVTLICFPSFFRYLFTGYPYRPGSLPFILGFAGIVYSFLLGLAGGLERGFTLQIVRMPIEWLSPLIFGFYLFSKWREYPQFKKTIERTFFWGAFAIGIYGLVQFCLLPPWDLLWQENALKLGFGNVGTPAPLLLNVWSTLNSPGALANVMIACLLLLFNHKNVLRIPLAIVCILLLLLSDNRTAWGSFVVGCILLIGSLKSHLQIRIILIALVILLSAIPLVAMEPFASKISERFQTLSNVKEDNSFQARQELYDHLLDRALINPIGYGMTSLELADSGVLVVFYEMGWLGAAFYVGGYISMFLNLFQNSRVRADAFLVASRAVSVSLFVMIPNGNSLTAMPGVMLWSFAGIAIAGNQYYLARSIEAKKSLENSPPLLAYRISRNGTDSPETGEGTR